MAEVEPDTVRCLVDGTDVLGGCVLPGCVLRVLGMTLRNVDGALELAGRVETLDDGGMLVGADVSVRPSTSP